VVCFHPNEGTVPSQPVQTNFGMLSEVADAINRATIHFDRLRVSVWRVPELRVFPYECKVVFSIVLGAAKLARD
jgi:hypothetical protein